MSRISTLFAKSKAENRAALIPFIMGYDPDAHTTEALLDALPKAGADILEIGIPFSDPMADGPTIQAAGLRALKQGATLEGILHMVARFRKNNNDTPIILMGYYNPIYRYGVSEFCKDASEAGVDGAIIVDLPPEEEAELKPYMEGVGLDMIRLIAPTTVEDRLQTLCDSATGFIYSISVAGITGQKSADLSTLTDKIHTLRQRTTLPVAAGFGIKTAAQVKEAAAIADAVVVGSALISVIEQDGVQGAATFVSTLAKGLTR